MDINNFIHKRINAFKYAAKGIILAFKQEDHLKIHTFFAIVVVLLAIILKLSAIEWCILLLTIGIVIAAEIINTIIERMIDIIYPHKNDKAAHLKDMAAGMVLVVVVIAVVIGFIIFIPYFFVH